MKARKKPTVIEVVEFDPRDTGDLPKALNLRDDGAEWQIWNQMHSSWIGVKRGDMIRVDSGPDDYYPISREVFARDFEEVSQ